MKRLFLLVSVCLLVLSGCSSRNSSGGYKSDSSYYSTGSYDGEGFASYTNGMAFDGAAISEEADYSYDHRDEGKPVENNDTIKKVIVTGSASVETLNFDDTVNKISSLVKKYDGYVQDSSSWKNSNGSRHIYLTVRIPADKFSAFTEEAKDGENFTKFSTNTKDITDSYYDVQARIESLEAEEKVVMDFYSKAETIEDLITVENRLTEIRYELNSYKTTMKNYELLTSYSTLEFSIDEVQALSATTDSFAERLEKTCLRSWENFKDFLEDALFWLIENVWYIIIWIGVIWISIRILRKIFKGKKIFSRKKKKKELNIPAEEKNVIDNEKKD